MAKAKPNLPGSSRMQAPATTGTNKKLAVGQNSKGATKKVTSSAKGVKMKKSC
jgi:hypothetical protein